MGRVVQQIAWNAYQAGRTALPDQDVQGAAAVFGGPGEADGEGVGQSAVGDVDLAGDEGVVGRPFGAAKSGCGVQVTEKLAPGVSLPV